jgi:hypothetical protein
MRKKLAKKNYSTVLYYRRSPEVEDDCDDFHECICNEPWKSRKLILVGHSSGACYIRYLRTHARGLHFLKSVALDGSFLYETIEYFLHIPNRQMKFKPDAPYSKGKSLRRQVLNIDASTDTDERERLHWYSNMYLTRRPLSHHVWVWYGEKPNLGDDVFQVKHERKHGETHFHVYANKYSHSLHTNEQVAKSIVKLLVPPAPQIWAGIAVSHDSTR